MPIVDLTRQAEARAFYDSPQWRSLRARHIKRNPNCVHCGRRSRWMTVDHKQPRRRAPQLALEPSNLQTLCRDCHDSTKRHVEWNDRHPMGGGVGLDGFPLAKGHPWHAEGRGGVKPVRPPTKMAKDSSGQIWPSKRGVR